MSEKRTLKERVEQFETACSSGRMCMHIGTSGLVNDLWQEIRVLRECRDVVLRRQKDKILMPEELTAENGAKYVLSNKFFEETNIDCPECDEYIFEKITVSWKNIKTIYQKAVELLGEKL